MAATDVNIDEAPPKRGKKGLVVALVLMIAAGGAGFFAAFSGMLPFGASPADSAGESEPEPLKPLPSTVFVALDPLVVTIRSSSQYRLLRFVGQLEVKPDLADEIEGLKPRIVDVMNTYLNALEARHFEDPVAMLKLRAQLLRRIQIVTGPGRVEDLLIMEFILQ